MTSLARGLAVMHCFADQEQPMTIAQASRLTGLNRSSVKRCLHTLKRLGYAAQSGSEFSLRPRVLALGYAYLSSSNLALRAQPLLDELRDELHESCSVGVIEEDEVVYVARAEVSRIISISLRVGSRLPLYCTSMGRVLLAALPTQRQSAYLRAADLVQRTPQTCVRRTELMQIFSQVAEQGFAVVDEELELGLRSVAVPVCSRGHVVAALNVGTQAARVSVAELKARHLPSLRRLAQKLEPII